MTAPTHEDPGRGDVPTPRLVLDTSVTGAATIGGLLRGLLTEVWGAPRAASTRRQVYIALAKAGHIIGTFDCQGRLDDVDAAAADRLIGALIDALTVPPGTPAEHRAQAALARSREALTAMEICNMPGPDGKVNITVTDVLEEWRDSLEAPPGTPHDADTARS